ncbi:MAG: acetaldehyde dehydrogenase [Sandaracinus sp.]|nr:acetaldehyde dehydrogenase [Sandaracinus sp.]|tara:strand:- start:2899 stop:3255 length:357 start_codon:yes stop_codon:yes gene_type:complete
MADERAPTASVSATPAALDLVASLVEEHGPLMFHQSGGCCDGSAPMCYPRGEMRLGARDVKLGEVGGQPFYIGGHQWERWKHTRLTLDVVPGRGAGFSIEAPRGVRFLIRSDVCLPDE